MNYKLKLALFGFNLAKLKASEIVYIRKKTTVVHIMSVQRINYLFTIEQLPCFMHVRGNRVHTCGAKVSTRKIVRGEPIGSILYGYIVEETFSLWRVNLCNNTIVDFPRGICSRLTGKYTFPLSSDLDRGITSVWPVRLLLRESGEISLILVRYCYNSDTNLIDETKCS